MAKNSGLGKGLGALLGESAEQLRESGAGQDERSAVIELKLSQLEPGKAQPRRSFDREKIAQLAQSIREYGVVQPIVARRKPNGYYEIIAGERRWRAARSAGLKTVPVIVREYEDERVLEIALIENLQREDLNPIEEARGYARLMDELSYTQEQLAAKLGKSRPQIANTLRLLGLCPAVQEMLVAGTLTNGHGRALLGLADPSAQEKAAAVMAEREMSVREAERYVKAALAERQTQKRQPSPEKSLYLVEAEEALTQKYGTKVAVVPGKKKGRIEIEFYGEEDLQRILMLMDG